MYAYQLARGRLPEALDLLRLIAQDLGAAERFDRYFPPLKEPVAEEENPFAALAGKTVAVYTLTERAGRQFKQVLEGRPAGVAVSLCHDLDGSKRLRQLARQADLFVVVTASAKHAATDCIEAGKRGHRELIFKSNERWRCFPRDLAVMLRSEGLAMFGFMLAPWTPSIERIDDLHPVVIGAVLHVFGVEAGHARSTAFIQFISRKLPGEPDDGVKVDEYLQSIPRRQGLVFRLDWLDRQLHPRLVGERQLRVRLQQAVFHRRRNLRCHWPPSFLV